jgi:hypothetical protein
MQAAKNLSLLSAAVILLASSLKSETPPGKRSESGCSLLSPNMVVQTEPGVFIDKRDSAKGAAIKEWVIRRQSEMRAKDPKASFEFIEFVGGDTDEKIRERNVFKGKCLEGYWAFGIQIDETECRYQVISGAPYAETCCADMPCPNRTPYGWMLELFRLSEKNDSVGLLTLVSPTVGFSTEVDNTGESDNANQSITYSVKQSSEAVEAIKSSWEPSIDSMECSPEFKDGHAKCSVGRSGGYAYFEWAKESSGVHLVSRHFVDTGE